MGRYFHAGIFVINTTIIEGLSHANLRLSISLTFRDKRIGLFLTLSGGEGLGEG